MRMHGTSDNLFSGSGLAGYEYRQLGRRQLANQLSHFSRPLGLPRDPAIILPGATL
jgi:hypothetical protein